ncbi:MAG: UDP-N-acetyl-D-glucosamine dehydrogenase [Gemmatimonadota bacterium]|nr:MAG: UDP-N-acetyl-D-glucosamine dehydrogenase [Gemmatimonadota bacterium]
MTLLEKLEDGSATLGIVGLGYVGLSLAMEFLRAGYRVIGIDIDATKVDKVNSGTSYVMDVPSDDVRKYVDSGKLLATTDYRKIQEVDTVNICVPTPLRSKTKDPDLSYILDAMTGIRKHLRSGQLIILESTTFPGTTTEVLLPILEDSGLQVGKDFFLAFSPERVDPGNVDFQTQNIPKVVGGVTPECTQHAKALYSKCLDKVVGVSSTDVAEMVKLLENTFRSVNIGLVNEFALLCNKLGIDVWEVIEAASTKPFGFMPFYPGPGLGGHCIPVDPLYLSWKAKVNGFHPRLIDVAVQVNQDMPMHIVGKVADSLKALKKDLKGSKILIIGVAYKRNTDDVRESPALEIIQQLVAAGATVQFCDPFVAELSSNGTQILGSPLTESILAGVDCALIVTDHTSVDYEFVAKHAPVVLDTRNAMKNVVGAHIVRL